MLNHRPGRLASCAPRAEGEIKSSLQVNPVFFRAFLRALWGYGAYFKATQPCYSTVLLKPLINRAVKRSTVPLNVLFMFFYFLNVV